MKTFKTFLFEEMASNNVSISDIAPQIPDTSKNLNFTPPTGPSNKPTKPVGKENTKKPNNKRSDDDDSEDDTEPDFDSWLANHPMPGNRDADGDGVVSEDEQWAYEEAWKTWRDELLDWMLNRSQNNQPRFPDDDEPYFPGEWGGQWHHWMRETDDLADERYRLPGDPPQRPLPPDMSKEDYEFWKKLLGIKGPESRDIFDWIWRFYRAGQPGFPHVESPVNPNNPNDVDPLFPNSPSRIPRRPGEYNA
tara:strand:+ start:958 stop:1704 length:747 start_codon:yes stop_codon:yes gene_type:complete